MKLFSEKVSYTSTDSSLNILKVKNFEEILFDVYEIEINKTKYPVEKISEHEGNPVVSVPVVVEGVKNYYPFVLIKGNFEVFFNENNTMENTIGGFVPIESSPLVETAPEFPKQVSEETEFKTIPFEHNKKEILEQIEKAKKKAKKELFLLKRKQQQELQEETQRKEEKLEGFLKSSRESLVDEFVRISKNIKNELLESADNRFSEISETIDNKILDLKNGLTESLEKDFTTSCEQFDAKIKELIMETYKSTVIPKVDEELKTIATEIVEKVEEIEHSLYEKVQGKADLGLIENVEKEVDVLRNSNIELNNSLNKGVNRALSRVGNVNSRIDELEISVSEQIDKKIEEATDNISNYYEGKLKLLEEKTFDVTEETRKYIIELVEESKNNLISEIRKLKNEKPIEYIVESNGKKDTIDYDNFQKGINKQIDTKINNEVARLRKYIAVYSGGGSVAQQFADGGTMNGNLTVNGNVTVVGSISASNYLGIPTTGITGNYLPLSGGTVTGNVTVIGSLSTKSVKFDQTAGISVGHGEIAWNADEGTLDIGMGSDSVVQQVGLEQYYRIKANGSTLIDGTVVWANDVDPSIGNSGIIKGINHVADGSIVPKYLLGVATETIPSGEIGYVTRFGLVRSVNLSPYASPSETWVEGDILYPSPTISGGWTNVEPQPPNLRLPIAMILSINNGSTKTNVTIMVRVGNSYRLEELHNVVDNGYTHPNGSTLVYNTSLSGWVAGNTNSLVVSSISAQNYYGITIPSGNYLPLSGGTLTGNLVVQSLTATNLFALSAVITVLDIKQYELSGFNITGNSTIIGTLSTTDTVYTNGGNSVQWTDTYTTVLANSSNWNNTYTTVNSNSGNWDNTYTTVLANSGKWNGDYLPLSGGTLTGPLSVTGQAYATTNVVAVSSLRANIKGNQIYIGGLPGSEATYSGIWLGSGAPTSTNYTFLAQTGQTFFNSANTGIADIEFRLGNSTRFTVGNLGAGVFLTGNTAPTMPFEVKGTSGGVTVLAVSTVNVGIGTATPVPTAILELSSSSRGFLPPRLTTAQKNTITSPATGLQVYDTTIGKPTSYNGSLWQTLVGGVSVTDIQVCTQAEYNALTPNATTLYYITDASDATSLTVGYTSKVSNYTVTTNDCTIDLLSGTYTFTLPAASSVPGKMYWLKNSGTGVLTISAAELIDGFNTQTLIRQYETLQIQSGTTKWVIL